VLPSSAKATIAATRTGIDSFWDNSARFNSGTMPL
jgi:hypothetical protein